MDDWARDHAENWDANDLLAKLATWQAGDVSAGPRYKGNLRKALGSIKSRVVLMPCTQDLYFPPEDNQIEAGLIPGAQFAPFDSDFGHSAANPGTDEYFATKLDENIAALLVS